MEIAYAESWPYAGTMEGYAVEHLKFGKLLDQLKKLTAAQAE